MYLIKSHRSRASERTSVVPRVVVGLVYHRLSSRIVVETDSLTVLIRANELPPAWMNMLRTLKVRRVKLVETTSVSMIPASNTVCRLGKEGSDRRPCSRDRISWIDDR